MNSNIRILVVEDDTDSMTLLLHYLKEIGYTNISKTGDPEEALCLLSNESFDLIISDHYMPSMTGIDFFKALRARPAWKDIPFLMTTSEGRKHKITEAISAGVRSYITKPVDKENLQTKINRLMNT